MTDKPHDSLFLRVFSDPARASGVLREVLPAGVVAGIDFGAMRPAPGSYVDPELGQSRSDVLFEAPLGGREGLVYVVFEHQSEPDRWMPWRLLKYMVRIWDRWLGEHDGAERLPAIIPVVLHHGEAGWTVARRFGELVDADHLPELGSFVPDFELVLDDLRGLSDEALRVQAADHLAALALWALRDARNFERFCAGMVHWVAAIRALMLAPSGREALQAVFRYTIVVAGPGAYERLRNMVIDTVGEEAGEVVLTAGEQLRREGRRIGRVEGARAMLLAQLRELFGELGTAVVARVENGTEEELERWVLRVVKARTAEEVFE